MQRPSHYLLFALISLGLTVPVTAAEKSIIGWVEPVKIIIDNDGPEFAAKIDTGADYSSIDIESLELLQKKFEPWLRFKIKDDKGKFHTLELPIYKITRTKRKGIESQPRFVVIMDICLGRIRKSARVSLLDRHNYKYRLLLGRNFLKNDFVVDPAIKNTTAPKCH